ncbi:MAG: ferrochelatase [Zetaproteobacteria bacterium]|nr:ferrochelatase [Pseudobdellovibrionaceae bacterium]|tara:strand:+ start:342 stop:1352 length:1011 start_codon:yes stop_codon:yes gene_type:complete
MKKGVLLINLGTPRSTESKDVRAYLKEFLSDKRVIDIHPVLRFLLLRLIILPFRTRKTKKSYEEIWQKEGSPLKLLTEKLTRLVKDQLKENYEVSYAMRYGNPSIPSEIEKMRSKCSQLTVIPLYPQYASSSTGSSVAKTYESLNHKWDPFPVKIVNSFYKHPAYTDSFAGLMKKFDTKDTKSHLLFSYHGIPERHILKSGCKVVCENCSKKNENENNKNFCYRYQCYASTSLMAKKLGLTENQYTVSFQSRLGKSPWIKPYTDIIIDELYDKGIRKLWVVCPSFVSDCLETLEEIAMELKEQWLEKPGTSFEKVPCLNADPVWVKSFSQMIRDVS